MTFEVYRDDDGLRATGLSLKDGALSWIGDGATHNIILRTLTQPTIMLSDEMIGALASFPKDRLLSERELPLTGDVVAVILPDQFGIHSYPPPQRHATYAVYPCIYDAGSSKWLVYDCNHENLYTVPELVEYSLRSPEIPKPKGIKGLLQGGKRVSEEGCYLLIPSRINAYADGELCYRHDGYPYDFPVTKAMLATEVWLPSYQGRRPSRRW